MAGWTMPEYSTLLDSGKKKNPPPTATQRIDGYPMTESFSPFSYLADLGRSAMNKVNGAVDRWNQATTVPIPRQFVGGTPENTAARQQFTQQAKSAANSLTPSAIGTSIRDQMSRAFPQYVTSSRPAAGVAPMNPAAMTGSSALTANAMGSSPATPVQSGTALAGPSTVDLPSWYTAPQGDTRYLLTDRRALGNEAFVPKGNAGYGLFAGKPMNSGLYTAMPASQPTPRQPIDIQEPPATQAQARSGDDPQRWTRLQETPGSVWQGGPAWSQTLPPLPSAAPTRAEMTGIWQEGMQRSNPQYVAPGPNASAQRDAIINSQRGYTASAAPESIAPATNAWQPSLAGELPGDAALAAQAQQRQATDARNQEIAARMQANAGPAWRTSPKIYQDQTFAEGQAPTKESYMQQVLAAREGKAAWPGAWRASPGEVSHKEPTPQQMERRQSWQDTKRARQRMVTARAQGRPITPEQAMTGVLASSGRGVSDDLAAAAWGPQVPAIRSQERIAMAPYSPDAMALQRELARIGALGTAAAAYGNQNAGPMPPTVSRAISEGLSGNPSMAPAQPGGAAPTSPYHATRQQLSSSPELLQAFDDAFKLGGTKGAEQMAKIMQVAGIDPKTGEALLQIVSGTPQATYKQPSGPGLVRRALESMGKAGTPGMQPGIVSKK